MSQEEECNIKKILNYLSDLQSDLDKIQLPPKDSGNNDKEASERSEKKSPKKRASWFGPFNKLCKPKEKGSNYASDSGGSQGGSTTGGGNIKDESAELVIRKLQSDIRQMITAFFNLLDFQNDMSMSLEGDPQLKKLRAVLEKASSMRTRSHDLKEIRRKVFTLKCQIPSLLYKQSSREMVISEDSQTTEDYSIISETGSDIYLRSLHFSPDFLKSSAFEEVLDKFQKLEFSHQLCLLSFAVFPENREVNRTMLMYWWIGEDYISCDGSENDSVKKILDDFSRKRLLEPVVDESSLKPSSYKMEPHVHSAVTHLAKYMDLFRLYDEKGKFNYKKTDKEKVCLVRGSSLQPDTKTRKMQPEKLETVFNSSERYPDFTFKWFPSMKSLKVLYLGRWERTAKRHIEVESTEFLKDIKDLKKVKLVSFQGISRIEKLENPICLLPNLVILDLKACYNLESLPSDIGLLQKLIYLDVSDCYMLDGMPKGISKLSTLEVLKGFVIGESDDERNCAVKHLKKLRKLSVTVNRYSFTVENLAESLKGLEQLQSLKIAWGARFPDTKNEENEKQGDPPTEKKGDGVSSKKEDGRNEEANLEEEKKHDELKAESLKSEEVVEGEKKASPSQEATETIQNKPENQERKSNVAADGDEGKVNQEEGKKQDEANSESLKSEKAASPSREETETPKLQKVGSSSREEKDSIQNKPDNQEVKSNVEGDGNKEKADLKEGEKKDEVEAETLKSDKVIEGEKKSSPPRDVSDMIQEKPDEKSKVENEGDGADKEKADLDEGKKQNEVEAKKTKSDNVVEGGKTKSPPQESKDTIDNKRDDKTKGKSDPEEGKKHDEVEAGISKSNNVVEEVKKASPARESTEAIQNKPDHHEIGEKQEEDRDEEKEKDNLDEGKKQNEVEAEKTKSDNVVEGGKTTSPPQESKDTIDNKRDDKTKGKSDPEEGKKHDEVEAGISKSNNVVEEVKKASPARESTEAIQNKPDDHRIGNKQEEKGDEEKEKDNQEEGKKKDEVEADSSKQDHREIRKVQEKGDGEKNGDNSKMVDGKEAKTHKSHKAIKFGKLLSCSGNSKETPSPSRPTKDSIHHTSKLPSSLKKLELECFPDEDPPKWLNPKDLNSLKKLSIKGGWLSRISNKDPSGEDKWTVQILRLKYLHKFKVEWKDLQTLFPEMTLLEKYECPKIAFCPTDGNGVWRKP